MSLSGLKILSGFSTGFYPVNYFNILSVIPCLVLSEIVGLVTVVFVSWTLGQVIRRDCESILRDPVVFFEILSHELALSEILGSCKLGLDDGLLK